MEKKVKQKSLVKKSNSLVRSNWSMDSIWEARLVALVASKTRVDDVDFKQHEIPISELLGGAGKQASGQIYKIIEDAARSLIRKVITVREPSGSIVIAGVFAQCRIDPGTGIIKVVFAEGLKSHYLQLKEKFTQYKLEEFLRLPSTYSQRIFEILMSWRNIPDGEVTLPMDDLHEQLDTPPALKKNFKDFRVRVLEQAQKDIMSNPTNPDASLDYEWQPVKQGRKVIAVRFIFNKGRIEKERREKEEEVQRLQSKRNNDLYIAAHRCSKNMATVPVTEQDAVQRDQKQEVCNMCQSQEMVKSLFPLECRRYKRVELLVD